MRFVCVAPDIPPEPLLQIELLQVVWVLSCRMMTPLLNMPGSLRQMGSRWPSDYFHFPKLKECLSGRRFSSNSVVKTASESCLNGQDVISIKPR
ncbi:hypothetical protein AVEN_115499-1 [Araneus ventricosus]|uniref:Uncharacterized protein n=1 Tax=Araneus ventricosus TaxID=182803 RepID=A0A4Y2Q2G4_ARAVE|nr:hypothetical protein AVEN_115499-1 [Araneus ventricosus]